jgi:hypothetical protein
MFLKITTAFTHAVEVSATVVLQPSQVISRLGNRPAIFDRGKAPTESWRSQQIRDRPNNRQATQMRCEKNASIYVPANIFN